MDSYWSLAWDARAQVYFAVGKFELAISDWEKALELGDLPWPVAGRILDSYRSMNDVENVIQFLDSRPATLKADHSLLSEETLAWINASGDARLVQARDRFTDQYLASLHAENEYLGLATFLRRIQRFEAAFAAYQNAIEQDDDPEVMNEFAWLLITITDARLHDPERAIILSQRSVVGATGGLAHKRWNTLGVALYYAARFDEALTALQTSHEIFPDGRELHSYNAFFLAMTHWQLGNQVEARRDLQLGEEWMDAHPPEKAELIRFRQEARQLITEPEPAAAQGEPTVEN